MTCSNCGQSNFAWVKRCEHCGHAFENAAPPEPTPQPQSLPATPSGPASAGSELQLDRAEFDGLAVSSTCAVCRAALGAQYFQINERSVCSACCERVRASLNAGSPFKRGIVAVAAGTGAAIAGSILYYALLALTGYEFGLIAIVVGYAVGRAVNWGAEGRGGWPYQTAAVVLTYLAIVSAYVPLMIAEMRKTDKAEQSQASAGASPQAVRQNDSPAAPARSTGAAATDDRPISGGQLVLGLLFLIAVICAAPFLQGASNILGLVIIGVGLYEAWKLNRRRIVMITGPHAIAAAGEVIAT